MFKLHRPSLSLTLRLILMSAFLFTPVLQVLGHALHYSTSNFQDRNDFKATLGNLRASYEDIQELAVSPTGEWVIITETDVYSSDAFPAYALYVINYYRATGRTIDAVAFDGDGDWVVVAEDYYLISGTLPDHTAFQSKLHEWVKDNGWRIDEIALTRDDTGFAMISGSAAWYSSDLPAAMKSAIYDRRYSKRQVNNISFGENGRWIVTADQWYASDNLTGQMLGGLGWFQKNEAGLDQVVLGIGSNYVIYGGGFSKDATSITDIEYGFDDGKNIWEKMAEANVPGLQLAVIENNEVVYARGYGTLESGQQRSVLASSPFDAASLSKFMGALTIMKVIEQGDLELDTDILDMATPGTTLGIWKGFVEGNKNFYGVPNADLPYGMTIERLLSHTAATIPHSSTTVTQWPAFTPSTIHWLLGMSCNSGGCSYGNGRTPWYEPAFGNPGDIWDYSGGGFLIAEAAAEQATGQRFEDLAETLVFAPLGMNDATFEQPLSASWENRAAVHHTYDGTPRTRAHYPWSAAGGLYTSAMDYARALIPLLNEGRDRHNNPFLSQDLVDEMMTDRVSGSGTYGLGIDLTHTIVDESGGYFAHNGSHGNRSVAKMGGHPQLDSGIVILVNSGTSGSNNAAVTLYNEIYSRFKCESGWTCP